MHPEAFGPTVPHHPPPMQVPVALPPPPRSTRGRDLVIVAAAALVGVLVGLLIGRATAPSATGAAPVVASNAGRLAVTSKPADGNVTIDGRFVGVSPIDRLDLDPGKHTIVIDVFGYQPYAGTLEIEPRGKLNMSVLLIPVGTGGTTTANVVGAGTATHVAVPPSALLPASPPPAPPGATRTESTPPRRASSAAPPPPPQRPHRDCDGEKSRCNENCRRTTTDCNFSCPGCSSCLNTVGWDECKRQCDACRSNCEASSKFCESSCDTQYQSCEASQ